ncbi:sulfite exporter TauE/SafE family protein [Dickeya zeae]|uniref:sulfite exporter TauE/SafE family protein n=1 Tax=Dickeya zeae TaxID=204042 RepID=UPI0003A8EE93|nr:sulfite exporter TauE/SafE family protein [Dickeya zeae]AUQ24380.1 sulfite exporter TauE/SafE family protein [Dickeya zeae]PXW48876.1 hypothetical protein DFO54_10195 [Erwinia sp. AG740]UJR57489.1 sulfite exporter TauE/SafE family protein [Dickeya zeae]UJR62906.1 sulfite exporter TauE/SafE family protein [Dickeya zeae]
MSDILILVLGLFAGSVSGIVGTGGSIILLPALAWAFSPQAAVPIMAIAATMSNISKVILWRKAINLRALGYYCLPGIPASVIGASLLWVMPVRLSSLCIGLFFLLLIPLRYLAHRRAFILNDSQLAMAGGVVGFLTGVVFSTGPLTIPLFAGYGLLKGALLATESAASLVIYLTKAATFGVIGALPWSVLLAGVLIGLTQVAGVYIGKRFVLHLSDTLFNRLVDSMMLIAGLSLLWETVPAN